MDLKNIRENKSRLRPREGCAAISLADLPHSPKSDRIKRRLNRRYTGRIHRADTDSRTSNLPEHRGSVIDTVHIFG